MGCYLFTEYFHGTRENVFIKGLLVYKYKHINVRHWEQLAELFASNWFYLFVSLSPQAPSDIPWRIWQFLRVLVLVRPGSMNTQHGKGYFGRSPQLPSTCTTLLPLLSDANMLPVLDFSALPLQGSTVVAWGELPLAQGAKSSRFGALTLPPVFKRSTCYLGIKWGLLWCKWSNE